MLHDLFNFLVRMTKETHLCHSLCSTSDCLFIEDIYSNARLEGRAKYILVDDLPKDEAYKLYDGFGFNDKGLVWDWIGGKVGDMVRLYEEKKQGYNEEEGLKSMLKDEIGRLEWIRWKVLRKVEDGSGIWEFLKKFRNEDRLTKEEIGEEFDRLIFWIEQNILFYNPVESTIGPQSRLLWRAIKEVIEN